MSVVTAATPSRVHVYGARGGCREAYTARVPELLLAGPAGTGKSRALLERLHLMALRYPGMRGLIVRKTLASLSTTALDTWRKAVVPEAQLTGYVAYYGGSRAEPAQYKYSNGSAVMIGGMDKPTKIMSSEYDVVYVQEAIELTVEDWESITTRLRNGRIPYQILMADTNPAAPTHWLKKRCDDGVTRLINSHHEDNPILFKLNPDGSFTVTERGKDYISKLDALTGVRRLRLRKGLWVAAEGLIFEEFAEDRHLLPRHRVPADWPRYWSVDFGFTHPFVLQCWAVDPDGRLLLYREIYRSQRLVEDHAGDILEAVTGKRKPGEGTWTEPRPQAIVCDHDAEDRATLERHLGMPTVPARKTVSDGLQAFASRLKLAGDGKPRIQLMRDITMVKDQELGQRGRPMCTAEEFPGYVWNDKVTREEPVKDMDDGMDAGRYIVMHLDGNESMGFRWMS